MYTLFVAVGIALGLLATRFAPPSDVPLSVVRRARLCGLLGAVAGAHVVELPADLFGWAAPALGHLGTPILGRTVLGGILGGWAGVELGKWTLGYVGATGDRFAAPLAIALACGRIGCVFQGCCQGVLLPEGSGWALVPPLDGPPRFAAALVEAYFHAAAAALLVVSARFGWLPGRRFSVYVALYALVRFALEEVRANPEVLMGLTYYQWLSALLFALAATQALTRTLEQQRAPSSRAEVGAVG